MSGQAEKAFQTAEKGMVAVSWAVTLFVTFMIVADICLRFFFNKPLPASWEISEVIMPYIVFFALSGALAINAHVKVTFMTNMLSRKGQRVCDVISTLICFLVCVPLVYWSWLRFWASFIIGEEIMAAIKIPWWLGMFAMPVGFGVFALRYLVYLIGLFRPDRNRIAS